MPRLSVLQRKLIGEGSHRRLTSSIKVENQPEVASKLTSLSCTAIIVERLPSGVFADPFELEHLTQRGVFTDASAFGDTDLELPTVRSNRSVVEIHMDLGPSTLSKNSNGWELNIELPLHARYAPLGKNGYTRVEFGSPDLFVHCIVEGDSHSQSCIYTSPNDGARSSSAAIVWEVPSGIVKHTTIVSVLTFISAVVGNSKMWRLKIAEGGNDPYMYSTNNFVGRQIWEFDPNYGTPEERNEVEQARVDFWNHRHEVKPSSDVLWRMQV
nr:phosphatidylinositol-glycan biosynthesis class X protein-like isoform X1 [Tanacetum cinerariifolium]